VDGSGGRQLIGELLQCTTSAIASGPTCLATLAFTGESFASPDQDAHADPPRAKGIGAAIYADSSPAHGRYFCGLVEEDGSVDRQWFDGGSIEQWAVGRKLCR